MYIKRLINSIKMRPRMYIEEDKLEYLFHFIFGYCGALHEFCDDEMDLPFNNWFWRWLINWIEENMDPDYEPKSVFWYKEIRKIAGDENKEFEVFFELSEQFFYEYESKTGWFEWRNDSQNE